MKLQWPCDVADLLRAYPKLDWQQIQEYARRIGCQRILTVGVLFAHKLLEAPLPTEVLEMLKQDTVSQSLVGRLKAQLLMDDNRSVDAIEPSVFYLQVRERLRDQVRYAFYLCVARDPVITGRASQSLPPSLTFLYYLLWPILVVGKYGLRSQKVKIRFSQWLERMG